MFFFVCFNCYRAVISIFLGFGVGFMGRGLSGLSVGGWGLGFYGLGFYGLGVGFILVLAK